MTSTKKWSLDHLFLPKHIITIYSLIASSTSCNSFDNTLNMLAGKQRWKTYWILARLFPLQLKSNSQIFLYTLKISNWSLFPFREYFCMCTVILDMIFSKKQNANNKQSKIKYMTTFSLFLMTRKAERTNTLLWCSTSISLFSPVSNPSSFSYLHSLLLT